MSNRPIIHKKKLLLGGACFLLLVGATIYAIFSEIEPQTIFLSLRNARLRYVLCGLAAMALFLCGEAVNIGRGLAALGHRPGFLHLLKYTAVGFFFSSITPSASGGQPMQLFFMHRDRLPLSHSTLALLMELIGFQTAVMTWAFLGLFFARAFLCGLAGPLKLLIPIGLFLNALMLVLLLLAVFHPVILQRCLGLLCRLVRKLLPHHTEAAEHFEAKSLSFGEEYAHCAHCFQQNPSLLVKICLTSLVQLAALHSIPYWVYCSFGLSDYGLAQILLLQAILFAAASSIPLPGAVGVTEGGFMLLFRTLFPSAILGSAMVVSRLISFYLAVVLSGLAVCFCLFAPRLQRSRAETGSRPS